MNINDNVTVTLTDYGKKILNKYKKYLEQNIHMQIKTGFEYDENDKYTTQLHTLMYIFGQEMNMIAPQVFEDNEIKLIEENKKQIRK